MNYNGVPYSEAYHDGIHCDWCNGPLTHKVPTVNDKLGQFFHWDCFDAYRCKELKNFLAKNKLAKKKRRSKI